MNTKDAATLKQTANKLTTNIENLLANDPHNHLQSFYPLFEKLNDTLSIVTKHNNFQEFINQWQTLNLDSQIQTLIQWLYANEDELPHQLYELLNEDAIEHALIDFHTDVKNSI